MDKTDENITIMLEKIDENFRILNGFPYDSPKALIKYAEQMLRIVHGKTIQEVFEQQWKRAQGSNRPCPQFKKAPPEQMDYDWLFEQAALTCRRFPTITQMREIYDQYFIAAEGRETWAETYDLLYNKD